jgi:8-oxo-dGTP diphosphatase
VPAGTVRAGEPVEEAVLREAVEETGLSGLTINRFLGRHRYDIAPYRDEVQDRFVFQLDTSETPPSEWLHHELHDRLQPPTAFRFYWLPLGDPELDELVVGQGALLDRISSLERPRQ